MDLEGVPPPVNMAQPAPVMIEDSSLTNWHPIGSGGFGQIYKARHKRWCYEVAIKLLRNDDGTSSSLLREVSMMLQGSNEYVMQVLGVFNGRPLNSGLPAQLGLVMKYMEKGSLDSLQQTFDRVQQLPLVFRLAHQVALGINFLHSLSPPILHRDLKPSNVLLDSDLNAKLTDFGLSQPSQTQAQVSKKDLEDGAGTTNYMPPEAFDINYKPSRSFDIYSYGILLWSIATGEQPYQYATPDHVLLLIPRGQRPSLEELSVRAADQPELRGLVELMIKCWETSPTQRPSSLNCTKITEKLYERQEPRINDAVHEVLKKLQKEKDRLTENFQSLGVTPSKVSPRVEEVKNQDHVKTGPPPVQEVVPGRISNQRVKDPPASRQANVCDGDTTRSTTDDHKLKASSVRPNGESPAPPSTTRSPQTSAAKNPPQSFQREFSSTTPSTSQPTRYVCIHCGNENTLYVYLETSERKQHPTAPSTVNPPSPPPGSRKNIRKTGAESDHVESADIPGHSAGHHQAPNNDLTPEGPITVDPEGVPPPVNMAQPAPVMIEDSILTNWVSIGAGGFGEIYKARHQGWCLDVAIKLLRNDDGSSSSLLREIEMMRLGSNEYVMQVLGVFRGGPPNSGSSEQLGLVMKYMEKGSLDSLQKSLDAVPPLPLVFRLAHQVALGINFLHSLSPPILHRDLKPKHVLLDSYLNVKLTGFGLSQPSQTQAQVSKKDLEDVAGTLNYMPPEAFDINYKPSRAFDIYSYGILLWSIATGEQPYPYATPSLMQLLIPKGQRPSLEELSVRAADQAELGGLVELMIKCWETSPTQRPSSLECTKITEKLFQRQKRGINDAVHEVLTKLEQKEQDKLTEKGQSLHVTPASGSPRVEAVKNQDHVKTGPPPVQVFKCCTDPLNTESSGTDKEMSVVELDEHCVLYMKENPTSTNTQLFCMLALLKAYVPESYLLMPECQRILGPPDPIHGGPPFEQRMEPFTNFIRKSSPNPGHVHVCMINQVSAQKAVEVMAARSDTVKNIMFSLCGAQAEPHVLQFIKDLLTKRETVEKRKEKFSGLVEDILKHESFNKALLVLEGASTKFRENATFPQVVSRLYYIAKEPSDYNKAEKWAKEAINRAPDISYIADTLGQVYKNRLLKLRKGPEEIMRMADEAFTAFKDVERKADNEEPLQNDTQGTAPIAATFNNRGLFGFLQVAKIAFEKLSDQQLKASLIQYRKKEVEDKFEFFEWYLTYSTPNETTLEPDYFWKDVALCYEHYTTEAAADSTSFPGLLDCLNQGLFGSRGKRAGFQEKEKSGFDLEEIQRELKNHYEENVDDVQVAERYILSNIILSNRMPDSPQLASVEELQTIILRFLATERRHTSPEFYLLVLLLWLFPEEQPPVLQDEDDEEVEQAPTDRQPGQLPLDLGSGPDLHQHVTFMEEAYERSSYAKYLRSRYLLPLFFLGKESGLNKWIHKSRLDAIVEQTVDAMLAGENNPTDSEKQSLIEHMWNEGDVWQLPEIQNILRPVTVHDNKVDVCSGGWKEKVSTEVEPKDPTLSTIYLGFNIKGPVLFKVGVPHVNND